MGPRAASSVAFNSRADDAAAAVADDAAATADAPFAERGTSTDRAAALYMKSLQIA
jgi:hypothetical protein